MSRWTLALAALLVVGFATASRVPSDVLQEAHEQGFGGLKGSQSNFGAFWRSVVSSALGKKEEREKGVRAYVAIRFTVPPSVGNEFEEAWLKLERKAVEEEKALEVLDLKYTKLDNLFYVAYGEWEYMHAMHEHVTSKHFEEFAEFVDKHNIRWQLEVLQNMSEEVEEEQRRLHKEEEEEEDQGVQGLESRRRRRRGHGEQPEQPEQGGSDWDKYVPEDQRHYIPDSGRGGGQQGGGYHALDRKGRKDKNMAHVVFVYVVRPDAKRDFVDEWQKAGLETVKEKHNRNFSLRKVVGDNTRFYGYGTWDEVEDFMEHEESEHVSRLLKFYEKQDIVYFMQPLEKVGTQPE